MLALTHRPHHPASRLHVEGKVEKTKANAKAQVAEAQSRATIAESSHWRHRLGTTAAIENTATSWKDEFALVVLHGASHSGLHVARRSPGRLQRSASTLPEWYTWLLFIAVSSSFGIKGVGQAAKMLGKGK